MRNPVLVLKSLEEKSCNKEYRYERLYRNLYNTEFYLLAYQNIAKSHGSMTAGTDGMTLDDMSEARINKIIASLKDHSYQPNPVRRTYIAKKNSNKMRPLGILSTDDKLVQEIVRMILEAIYEPTFSQYSHGFRPNRSCHTALLEIQTTFTGAKWIIEGDIKACFDSFDHQVLISLLRRRIQDEYFISLMWKFFKAGYMEQWDYHQTYSGTAQGSGISPILANAYLNELDNYMAEYKAKFDVGNTLHRPSKEYRSLYLKYNYECKKYRLNRNLMTSAERANSVNGLKKLRKEVMKIPYYPALDPDFKRLQYNRYADDFLIGIIGSKEDAERVKADVKQFLQKKLKLIMSEEKTKVTHSSDMVRYLGYDVTVLRDKAIKRDKNGVRRRVWYGRVRLYVPKEKWISKLHEYNAFKIIKDEKGNEKWLPLHRAEIMNKAEIEIISKYNAEVRGLYNYYRLAENASILCKFANIMKVSMFKTFAAKYKTKVRKIKKEYLKNGVFGINYYNKSGLQRCEFYHDGFGKDKNVGCKNYVDIIPTFKKYDKKNSLAARLKQGICEFCGDKTEDLRMHHVKKLKDLTGATAWELLMIEKRRKSLALCSVCHEKLHDGLL